MRNILRRWLNALEKKQIKGAALDVLENENLNTYSSLEKNQLQQLLSYNNVIITPHIAGITKDAHFKLSKFLVANVGDCNILYSKLKPAQPAPAII